MAIENVTPSVDNGAFPVKRTTGDTLTVEADVIADGHEVVSVVLLWRERAEPNGASGGCVRSATIAGRRVFR